MKKKLNARQGFMELLIEVMGLFILYTALIILFTIVCIAAIIGVYALFT